MYPPTSITVIYDLPYILTWLSSYVQFYQSTCTLYITTCLSTCLSANIPRLLPTHLQNVQCIHPSTFICMSVSITAPILHYVCQFIRLICVYACLSIIMSACCSFCLKCRFNILSHSPSYATNRQLIQTDVSICSQMDKKKTVCK